MAKPTPVKRYHDYLLQTVSDLNVSTKWFVSPLNLGGVPGEGGGSGIPLAGVVGQLIQSKIAYDTTEASNLDVPASGQSLVHNLNRIRYWLGLKSPEIVILDEGVEIASGVRVMDFLGVPVTVTLASGYSDRVNVTISGAEGGITGSGLVLVSADDTSANYLENKLTAASSKITVTTANPGGNEERQVDLGTVNIADLDNVVITSVGNDEILGYSGGWINRTIGEAAIAPAVHTHLEADITNLDHDAVKLQGTDVSAVSPTNADILTYSAGGEWIPSGLSEVMIDVQEDDTPKVTNATILNFEGAVTVIDSGGGKATITISGVSGSGIAGINVEENDVNKVTEATILNFVSGATITDAGGGQANIVVSGGGGGDAADFTIWMPDASPSTAYSANDTDDDEFDDASFDAGIWTEFDVASTQTVGEDEFGAYMTTTSTNHMQGIYQPVPSGISDWSFTTYTGPHWDRDNSHRTGILLLEDINNLSASECYLWSLYRGGAGYGWQAIYHTDYDSWSADDHNNVNDSRPEAMYLRFRRDGTNWYFDYSTDGKSWVSNQYERAKRWNITGIGIGHKFDNTSMKARFQFARFKDDSDKDQILYGDRVDLWRAS